MAITDRGVPSIDPHTTLKTLIESNMTSPDGTWTPVVNPEWLLAKKQKTYQICIQPIYGESENATLGTPSQIAVTSRAFMSITLFAPTRTGVWSLLVKMKEVLNNGALTSPADGINDYHYIIMRRTDSTKPIAMFDPECGPSGSNDNCIGYRIDLSVELRWEE